MDFLDIKERASKTGSVEIYPDFRVVRSDNLMIRGGNFYAIWDSERGLWSTDEYDVQRMVDKALQEYSAKNSTRFDGHVSVKWMRDFSTRSWAQFKTYLSNLSDNHHTLDEKLTFQNTEVKKTDYVSKRLPYPLEAGNCDAWNELVGTLYLPEEREKIEWAIGSIVAGDSKTIQKFIVLYGEAGGGKSTILNIIQKLFAGYYTTFEAKTLTSSGNLFSTESFKGNPLVAIQHDGDLSGIEDNTKLNSIVSHEEMTMNEKYKPSYTARINCFLFIGTNKPVRITDGKSGIIRRLIDVSTSGNRIPTQRYNVLMSQIDFELGQIAQHCLEVYRKLGKNYYSSYKPLMMMQKTDIFYNFVESCYYQFKKDDTVTLSRAYDMYKEYCQETLIEHKLPRHKFREELKNYFNEFSDMTRIDGKQVRSIYNGFKTERFDSSSAILDDEPPPSLVLDSTESLLDLELADCPAQYASSDDVPAHRWIRVTDTLKDINTKTVHYVKPPSNHIVIDFDLTDENGNKSAELNLREASKWPPTYAEFSKSGKAIHLHYIYEGDVERLRRLYDIGIEVKVFTGDAALRRKLTKCNNIPIAKLTSGLPLKGDKKVINFQAVKSEQAIRSLIQRNLDREIHGGTKPSIDFIKKILDDAYENGVRYDVSDMLNKVILFASRSTNHPDYCLERVGEMKFSSIEPEPEASVEKYSSDEVIFFDIEVFKNLFLICWKYPGPDKQCVAMINPSPSEVDALMERKLIGFNCRRYDNHILYGRHIGFDNQQLFELSSGIVGGGGTMFREAYQISYTDVYDFASIKQSLKMWEIQLGIEHKELDHKWDKPIPESEWHKVIEYCSNDVIATEAVFNDRKQDFVAREILADLSGLTVNDTTAQHIAKILFGNDPNPQDKFVYTDLSTKFPGYTYDAGVSSYRGEDPGDGGYVYAEPGMYSNVALLDVASMHPTSIEVLNLFGKYTPRYTEIKNARLAIKHGDFALARTYFDGKLEKYLGRVEDSEALAYALKIALNTVYGLTYTPYASKFRDMRNRDNIVAKYGALFMIDLKFALQERGTKVIHIKTDSVKIPDATPEDIEFVKEMGKRYGFTFEHEATYQKFCLVNKAVYIAQYASSDRKHANEWTPTGAEFAHPYVFKTLFSRKPIEFIDYVEVKSVSSPAVIYLDFNESLDDVTDLEKELSAREYNAKLDTATVEQDGVALTIMKPKKLNQKLAHISDEELAAMVAKGHNYVFVGKVGSFVAVKDGTNGGILLREKEGKYGSVVGTKGWRWMESQVVKGLGLEDNIETEYYESLVEDAIEHLGAFGNISSFLGWDIEEFPLKN